MNSKKNLDIIVPIFKTVCQNKSLSPMSLFLAINQHFVILYLSKHIYMCTMDKFAKTNQPKHGNISICSVWYFKIIDTYISAFRFNKPLSQFPFRHNYKTFKFQNSYHKYEEKIWIYPLCMFNHQQPTNLLYHISVYLCTF